MRSRITALALASVAAVALVAGPVAASGAQPVTITLTVDFTADTELFTATGAFCPSGSAETFNFRPTGGGTTVFHLTKTFTCQNGDSLTVDLSAVFQGKRNGTVGGWTVTGGTGAYAGAMGGGRIVGVGTPTGIIDTYTGVIVR
jgi:hypothetical protein